MTDSSSPRPLDGGAELGDDLDRARDADFDLRLVRYFTVVAEHRHFGRAAETLHVAQPSLSRQIRRLEQQVGARLLDRTPRGTRLTGAGEVFLPQARALLKAAAQAAARTRAAAEPSRLIIGYVTGVFVTGVARELRRRNPDADIQVSYVDLLDAREALLDHRVDAVVARLPFRTDGLHVTILYDEPRVVLLPLGHRLAGREYVTLDDIAEEPLPRFRNADPAWSAYWRIEPRPDGRRAPDGPIVEAIEDKFEVIAAGEAIAIGTAPPGFSRRPDITTVPLRGVDPCHVVLATRADDNGRLVTAFRKLAMGSIGPFEVDAADPPPSLPP